MIAAVVVHSTGINWGQAFISAITIVVGLGTIVTFVATWVNKRRENQQTRFELMIDKAIDSLGKAVGGRLDKVDEHLVEQDKRLTRIDRNTNTDST